MTNEKADQKIETERCQGTSEQTLCFLQTKVMTQREQIVKTTVNPVGVGLWLSDALVSFGSKDDQVLNKQS